MSNVVRPACLVCVWNQGRALLDQPMTRTYIREKGKFVPAGWLCPNGHYAPIVEPWSPTGSPITIMDWACIWPAEKE